MGEGPRRVLSTTAGGVAIASLMGALVVLAGCGGTPESLPATQPSDVPASSVSAGLTQEDIAEAIGFRDKFGLRAEEAWVRLVASDPTAARGRLEYGVPLLPAELSELNSRPSLYRPVADAITSYGEAHPEEWAGLWIDQQRGGIVVAHFSENAAAHEAGLRELLSPEAQFEVRDVRWSLTELNELWVTVRKDFDGDHEWLDQIPAAFTGGGVDKQGNRVRLRVSSEDPDAASLIRRHYGVGADILRVESDGTGVVFRPFGRISVLALNRDGKPVPDLDCGAVRDGHDARGGVGIEATTDRNGRCSFEKRAFGYAVYLTVFDRDGKSVTVATGHVDVPAKGVASLTLIIGD